MKKNLGLKELIAIAIGGMVGGGIFTILGISVSMVGAVAPFAIALGGVVALFASYAYVKLGVYYKDEGATYAFFKRTYPDSHMAASFIGWYTIFGYISTLALYAYTFSSYALSAFSLAQDEWIRKLFAIAIVWVFTLINMWSVKGMGRIEDLMVYIKLFILLVISVLLIMYAQMDFSTFNKTLVNDLEDAKIVDILRVASVTFVAYEGFQLVTNAVKEMSNPDTNIPRAIYGAVFIVAMIYFIIALAAVMAIPVQDLIANKEYALAAGAEDIMGDTGRNLVVAGAVLATSSAINSTLFGSSRQMARIADDGYLPKVLGTRKKSTIPIYAILAMAMTASLLILVGGLRLILEFGSITFLLVSLLMAVANFKIRKKTNSSSVFSLITIFGLMIGSILILHYEYITKPKQLLFIAVLYGILTIGAYSYSKIAKQNIG